DVTPRGSASPASLIRRIPPRTCVKVPVTTRGPYRRARFKLDVNVSLFQFSSFPSCASVPSDSNPEHFQPNWLTSTANALLAGDASC
ncbi:MAG: hypothetical protein ACKO3V_07175, partial [Pirellula sp.]